MHIKQFREYLYARKDESTPEEWAMLIHFDSLLRLLEYPRRGLLKSSPDGYGVIYNFYNYTNLLYILIETLSKLIAYRFGIKSNKRRNEIFNHDMLKKIVIRKYKLPSLLTKICRDQEKLFAKANVSNCFNNSVRCDFTHESGMRLYNTVYVLGREAKPGFISHLNLSYVTLKDELVILFTELNLLK